MTRDEFYQTLRVLAVIAIIVALGWIAKGLQ